MVRNLGAILSSLTLITLPIGNTGDITLRALEALKEGNCFFAEDTRVFKDLLKNLGIDYKEKYIDSFHDQSVGKIELIIKKIEEGTKVYLVSDAGSPAISDPAYPLIKEVVAKGIDLHTLPGVTSVVTALELSGLAPHPFHFWGFIGRSKNEKKEFFNSLNSIVGTHIFFESPHRITDTIEQFFETHGDKTLVLARELTKTYESVYRLRKDDLNNLKEIVMEKGEFVVLFHNDKSENNSVVLDEVQDLVRDYLEKGGTTKKLAKIFAKILDEETKSVYEKLGSYQK